jgi:hypothetical protein
MRVVATSRSNSLTLPRVAALGMVALVVLVLNRAWGATVCPQVTASAPCPKTVKAAVKTAVKVRAAAVTVVATEPAPAEASWRSTLDPLSAGGWVLITDGPVDNPSVVYASTHNVLRNGNVVTAWVRWEYSRIQAEIYPLHYQSAVTHEELDCDARSYRRAAVFFYRRNNLQDKALQFTALDDDTTWKLAIPGSEGDAMLNWACAPVVHKTAAGKSGDGKSGGGKSGAAAAAPSSAPSSAPAAAGGGIDMHTRR